MKTRLAQRAGSGIKKRGAGRGGREAHLRQRDRPLGPEEVDLAGLLDRLVDLDATHRRECEPPGDSHSAGGQSLQLPRGRGGHQPQHSSRDVGPSNCKRLRAQMPGRPEQLPGACREAAGRGSRGQGAAGSGQRAAGGGQLWYANTVYSDTLTWPNQVPKKTPCIGMLDWKWQWGRPPLPFPV